MAGPTARQRDDDKSSGKGGKESASGVADKVRDAASGVADRARDTASHLADQARETAGNVAKAASGMVSNLNLGDKAESAASSVAGGMQSLAGSIRDRAPQEGVLGSAASGLAGGLENAGKYLEEQGLSGMTDDLATVIRRNPIPAVLLGIGVGFLLARATSNRS